MSFTCKTKETAEQIHDVVQEAIQQMLPNIMKHPEACLLPASYCPMMFIKNAFLSMLNFQNIWGQANR